MKKRIWIKWGDKRCSATISYQNSGVESFEFAKLNITVRHLFRVDETYPACSYDEWDATIEKQDGGKFRIICKEKTAQDAVNDLYREAVNCRNYLNNLV